MSNRLAELGAKYLVGSADVSIAFWKDLQRVAATPEPVLITGETGTGKEQVARELHHLSPRRRAPLHTCNCADLTRETATSELFGHEKGAFTGADRAAPGLFKSSDGATLFLDELGELPTDIQAKLLRVIQSGEIRTLGLPICNKVDVRIVAATNVQISKAIANSTFRRDLKERFTILHLVPLRDRPDDIPPLVDHFIRLHAEKYGYNQKAKRATQKALDRLRAYSWPGNIRELEKAVLHALSFTRQSGDEELDCEAFPALTRDDSPLDDIVRQVAAEQRRLADAIIDSILAGGLPSASPSDLCQQFCATRLDLQLASRFQERFSGMQSAKHREQIFGLKSRQAINRYLSVCRDWIGASGGDLDSET